MASHKSVLYNLCFQCSRINSENSVTPSERRQRGGICEVRTLHFLTLVVIYRKDKVQSHRTPLTQQYNVTNKSSEFIQQHFNNITDMHIKCDDQIDSTINILCINMKVQMMLPASPLNAFSTATPLSSSCLCFSSTCSSCLWMI